MSWLILLLAGFFEVVWAGLMKSNALLFRPGLFTGTCISMFLSVGFLWLSLKRIPLGTAYATWTGIGAIGAFALGVLFFREPMTAGRLISLGLLVVGIVGLRLTSAHH
jgi:quaternary ammonium compound-resistance protein SugE